MGSKANMLLTMLEETGYSISNTYTPIKKEVLEEMNLSTLHRTDSYDNHYIRDTISGDKNTMIVKNCYFEAMNIRGLRVKKKAVFFNTYFHNVKIKDVLLSNAIFVACKFENTYFIQTVCDGAIFVNCDGIENVEFVESKLNHSLFFGVEETLLDSLDENQCEYRDICFLKEVDIPSENREIKAKKPLTEKKECNKYMDRESIEQQEFSNLELKKEDLENKIFFQCVFHNISIENHLEITANTDFIECTFIDSTLSNSYTKVAFDSSTFNNVIFQGAFSHCSFVKCDFIKSKIDLTTIFSMCNFDYSNANVQFKNYLKQFTDCIIIPEQTIPADESDQQQDKQTIKDLLYPIYNYIKEQEIDETPPKESNPREQSMEFITKLSDTDFILFLTEISTRRATVGTKVEVQQSSLEDIGNDEDYL